MTKKPKPIKLGRVHYRVGADCDARFCGWRVDFVELHGGCSGEEDGELGTLVFIPDPPKPKKAKR